MSWERTQRSMLAEKIGAGVGEVSYLVDAKTPSDHFYWLLKKRGVRDSKIYTALGTAYDAMQDSENDTLIVYPGDHVCTEAISIDKDYTHIVGTDPNIEGDYTQGGCNIYTTTASNINDLLDISAKRSHFENLKVTNAADDTGNLGAVKLYGEGNIFKRVSFMGIMGAAQLTEAHAYSLCIDRGGYFPYFEDCIIGQNTWGPRSGACGHLWITNAKSGYPVDNGTFRRCKFTQYCETTTTPMVLIDLKSIDRIWLFDSCSFYNYYSAVSTQLDQVFDDDDTFYTHTIILKNCVAHGFHEWSDSDIGFVNIAGAMPDSNAGGGLTTALSAAV
jgi:hypothetical protein